MSLRCYACTLADSWNAKCPVLCHLFRCFDPRFKENALCHPAFVIRDIKICRNSYSEGRLKSRMSYHCCKCYRIQISYKTHYKTFVDIEWYNSWGNTRRSCRIKGSNRWLEWWRTWRSVCDGITNCMLQRLPVTRAPQRFFSIWKTKFWWTSIKCFHDNSRVHFVSVSQPCSIVVGSGIIAQLLLWQSNLQFRWEMESYYVEETWSVLESHSRNTFCKRNVCQEGGVSIERKRN